MRCQPINLIQQRIGEFLPFRTKGQAWGRVELLEEENRQVVVVMRDVVDSFQQAISVPSEIYLTLQQVRSLTVYVRWRKRGVSGDQGYLLLQSDEGRAFLGGHSEAVRQFYRRFDRDALDLNLAHSLRLNEIRRIRKYLADI